MMLKQSKINFSPEVEAAVESCWHGLNTEFQNLASMPIEWQMARREISFHNEIKLLGYFSHLFRNAPGAIIEIGVWKGKSLTLMKRMSLPEQIIIGIDPLGLPGQRHDFSIFKENFFADAIFFDLYSEAAFVNVSSLGYKCKLLHIDGGHKKENVALDFLLYSRLVSSGGLIVFDDYGDKLHSPEVGPTIDMLADNGYFSDFDILGMVNQYHNSFVLQRK